MAKSVPILLAVDEALQTALPYPIFGKFLPNPKGHLFVRWEDARERFNVEALGEGLKRFDDAHYRQWPLKVTEEEMQAEGYLKSLAPAEELAVFLSIRGMCLREHGRRAEAAESFAAASLLVPGCRSYGRMLAELRQSAGGWRPPVAAALNENQRKD